MALLTASALAPQLRTRVARTTAKSGFFMTAENLAPVDLDSLPSRGSHEVAALPARQVLARASASQERTSEENHENAFSTDDSGSPDGAADRSDLRGAHARLSAHRAAAGG